MEKKRSATASGEDYLEAVLVLQKEKGMVRSVDVARHMGVSKPSVCHAVVTLKKGGFLTMDEDLFLRLTDIGREVAEQTYEKHCFFTHLLMEAGVEPEIGAISPEMGTNAFSKSSPVTPNCASSLAKGIRSRYCWSTS